MFQPEFPDRGALNAPDPLLDPARLTALHELDLLSRPPQDGLTSLSRIASQMLGVPVSALSLISWDRQITAGQVGLGEATSEPMDAPLSHSFCQHVVRADAPFVVEDAREHPLVQDNLAIRDSNIIAYAGVPIRIQGECVGALCACDHQPRRWLEADVDFLTDIAALAVDVLELQRLRAGADLHDALTGLPRAGLFVELVSQMLDEAEERGQPVTVVAIDLRAFRLFNEAWGHEAGDAILHEVAQRFRDTMGSSGALCRLAGDEFLVAQLGPEAPDALVGRLRQMLLASPIRVAGVEQPVTALFAPVSSSASISARELVDAAIAELATAKVAVGPSTGHHAAGPAMQRLRIRNAIGGAERRGELVVHYQPLYDLATGRIRSLEALLRWEHPELGPVAPSDFVPVAERTGAIVPIGEWVLRTACRDLAEWREQYPSEDLSVAVNVAPEQVRLPSLDGAVAAALSASGLPSSALALEITERTMLNDRALERRTIDALQARGIALHLDDFGTGYSSLGYLTRFPLAVLKIDRIFVSRLEDDPSAAALVNGIVAMAHSLGLETVAEGIETQQQRDTLAAMGCDQGQGFWLARPGPVESIPALLNGPTLL